MQFIKMVMRVQITNTSRQIKIKDKKQKIKIKNVIEVRTCAKKKVI